MTVRTVRRARRNFRLLICFTLVSTSLTSTVRAQPLKNGTIFAIDQNTTRSPADNKTDDSSSDPSDASDSKDSSDSSDAVKALVLPTGVASSDVATWVGATNLGIANMLKNDPGFSCPLLPALPANFKDIASTVDTFAQTLRSLDPCFGPEDRKAVDNNLAQIVKAAQGLQDNARKIYSYHDAHPVAGANGALTPQDRTLSGPISGLPSADPTDQTSADTTGGPPNVIPPILRAPVPPTAVAPSPIVPVVPAPAPISAPASGSGSTMSQADVLAAISDAGNQVTVLGSGISTAINSVQSLITDKRCLDRGHAQFYGKIASDLGNVMTSAVPLLSAAQTVPGAAGILAGFPAVKAVLAGVGFGTEALGTAINIAGQIYTAKHPYDMGDPAQEKALINSLCEYYRLRVRSDELMSQDRSVEAKSATGAPLALNQFSQSIDSALARIAKNHSRSATIKRAHFLDIKQRVVTESQRKSMMAEWGATQDELAETITQITQQLDNAWLNLETPLNDWIIARNQMVKSKQVDFCDTANSLADYSPSMHWNGVTQPDKNRDTWGPIMAIAPKSEDDQSRVCSSLIAGENSWTEYRAAVLSESSVCSVVNNLVHHYKYKSQLGAFNDTKITCIVGYDDHTGHITVVPNIAGAVDRMLELESLGFSRIYKVFQNLKCSSN